MNYVLYHGNCYDGFGAAYATWKKFGDEGTKYIPVSYGKPPPNMPDATKIYVVDFSYSKEVIFGWLDAGIPVTLLDHHKTAKADLEPLMGSHSHLHIVFDMERSGAKIAWEFFHGESAPMLIEHISDRDLWTFKLEGTKEIHTALVSLPFDFKLWDSLDVETLKVEGKAQERLHESLVAKICDSSWEGEIDGYKVPIVNTSIAWSEVGHKLLEDNPEAPFVGSFTIFKDQIMWSLRCRDDFDVSAVAKKFGGGGHQKAAGFKAVRP